MPKLPAGRESGNATGRGSNVKNVGSIVSGVRPRHRVLWTVVALLAALAASLGVSAATLTEASAQDDRDREPQIVGGSGVPNGKYPFMVSLQADRVETPGGHFCGGTLIDRDSVLTAAHCLEFIGRKNSPSTLSFRDVRLVVGRTVLTRNQGQVRGIARFSDIKVHPRFRIETFTYDAAVIELDRPVRGIKPIKLAGKRQNALERPGRRAIVAGWGNTIAQSGTDAFFGGEVNLPRRMQEARPPLVSDRYADRVYKPNVPTPDFVPPLMVAAGENDVDTCQGDSGGPLFARQRGSFTQIGITSYGLGCGALGFPGVYAEVNSPAIKGFITRAAR